MTDSLESLISVGKFVSNEDEKKKIDEIMDRHMNGENVMGELKSVISISLERYLKDFQEKKSKIPDSYVQDIIEKGKSIAKENAKESIAQVRKAMSLEYI